MEKLDNMVIPYVTGISEKLRRTFSKRNIHVHFTYQHTDAETCPSYEKNPGISRVM